MIEIKWADPITRTQSLSETGEISYQEIFGVDDLGFLWHLQYREGFDEPDLRVFHMQQRAPYSEWQRISALVGWEENPSQEEILRVVNKWHEMRTAPPKRRRRAS